MAISLELPTIPRRPAYYYEELPLSSRQSPAIPPLEYIKEVYIRATDQSARDQLNRYAGDQLHQTQRALLQATRGIQLELGGRILNGTLATLAESTNYGKWYQEIRDSEKHEDHGHGHERRVMRWIGDIINNSPEFHLSDERLLLSLALYSDHDQDELVTQARNEEDGLFLNPKLGHGQGASYRKLATAEYLAREAGISLQSAKELGYISALMTLLHDRPEELEKSLRQTEIPDGRKAYRVNQDGTHFILRGEQLEEVLREGVDLTSLRPSQIAEIAIRAKLKDKKGNLSGFITDETPHGLDPRFEEEFRLELESIFNGNYYRMGKEGKRELKEEPLPLTHITPDFRRQFVLIERIAVFADGLDKVVPAAEAALRKSTVDIATKREFYKPGIYDRATTREGDLSAEEDSDAGRTDYELWHLRDSIQPFPGQQSKALNASHYVRSLVDSIGISGFLAERRIGTMIMKGNEAEIRAFVEKVYGLQLSLLGVKYLKKTGILTKSDEETPSLTVDEMVTKLQYVSIDYAERLQHLQRRNESLINHAMNCLLKKPDSTVDAEGKKHLRQYDPEDIAKFQEAQDLFLHEKFGLTYAQISELQQRETDEILYPFHSYYSGGRREEARTYRRHPHQPSRREQRLVA